MFRIMAVAVLGFLLISPGFASDVAEKAAIKAALARADKLIAENELTAVDAFFISQGARLLGKAPGVRLLPEVERNKKVLPYSVEYKLWQFRDEKLLPGISVPVSALRDGRFRPEMANLLYNAPDVAAEYAAQLPWMLQMLRNAFACQPGEAAVSLVGEPDYEYISVHQVMGLVIAHRRGCFSDAQAPGVLSPYVTRIWREFGAAPADLTDVQAGRAALLCMVGQCGRIPPDFVARLLKAQQPQGYWVAEGDPAGKPGIIPPGHTSALIYYLLSRRLLELP